jgi:hypothetical protein
MTINMPDYGPGAYPDTNYPTNIGKPSSGSNYPAAGGTGDTATPSAPADTGESNVWPLPEDTNLRRNKGKYLRFNCAIPNALQSSRLYKKPNYEDPSAAPMYRESGFNEKGMIVRDFAMNARLDAANAGWASTVGNWGFQFHFNPTEFSESYSAPMDIAYADFIRDIAVNPLLVMSVHTGSTIAFNLLLARREDMAILLRDDWQQQYPLLNRPTEEDRSEILARGTQYDLEYLFRVVNLDPVNTWREQTSDWGMLMGTPVMISLGDSEGCRKFRAVIMNMNVQHQQYAPGMIPVYTIVQIVAQRITDMYGVER